MVGPASPASPPVGRTATIDEFRDWLDDPVAAATRASKITEYAHYVAVPVVISMWMLIGGARPTLVTTAIIYAASFALVLLIPRGELRATALAAIDLVVLGVVAGFSPDLLPALTIGAVAAVSVGWIYSRQVGYLLVAFGTATLGAGAIVGGAQGAVTTITTFGGITLIMAVTNGHLFEERNEAMERVNELLSGLPALAFELDVESRSLSWTIGNSEELLGCSTRDLRDMRLAELIHAEDLDRFRTQIDTVGATGRRLEGTARLRHSAGTWVPVRVVLRLVDGKAGLLRGVCLDIELETRARHETAQYLAIVERMNDAVLVIERQSDGTDGEPAANAHDPSILAVQWNPAAAMLFGLLPHHDQREPLASLVPTVADHLAEHLGPVLDGHRRVGMSRLDHRRDANTVLHLDYEVFPLTPGSAALRFTDVTDRERAQHLIRHQALHDPLTHLPNRAHLLSRLETLLSTASAKEPLGLLLIDLDHFKEVNDTLGHQYGDQLLSVIARRVGSLARFDTVARLGGDEFALIVDCPSGRAELELLASEVARVVSNPVQLAGLSLQITPSIGIVLAPEHGDEAKLLLQRADVAMYDAKNSSTGWRLYRPTEDHHSVERLALMSDLQGVLYRHEIQMWFQPKVDLRTGSVAGLETLVRWEHPRLGLLGPDSFLELMELSGDIGELTWYAIDQALEHSARWGHAWELAVNVPVRNLRDVELPERLASRLHGAGMPPSRFLLEITEREIMDDSPAIQGVLSALRDLGVRLAIDDFGTGYSSLRHLRRLPVSEIKVDRAFVMGMLSNDNDYLIAHSIIDLAHNLGHRVVAEGVEDEATLALLTDLGCDQAQGFHFSRPVPHHQVLEQVRRIESGYVGTAQR